MEMLTNIPFLNTATVLSVILVTSIIIWIKRWHTFWSRRGLLTPPTTFFFGNCKGIFTQKQSFGGLTEEMYNYIKKTGEPHGGFYFTHMPIYMPIDPEIVKHIMQNDFDHFVDRGIYYNEEVDPLSAHLFSLDGYKWRKLRAKLTPTFTSGKMKMMFPTLVKCGDQLLIEMEKNVGKEPVDIKDMLGRFTTDIIGNCAFGIDCNSLKDPDNEYTKYFKLFFVNSFLRNIVVITTFIAPKIARKLSFKAINPRLSKFFMKMINETVQYREKNNIYRTDFMHLLLQLKNRGQLSDDNNIFKQSTDEKVEGVTLTMNEIAAQAIVFFVAGYETSSTAMSFCLFELASNQQIQEKLRDEINKVLEKHDNELSYDALMEMHYMDQVINETLRKYPPLPGLNRVCTKKYKVPGSDFVIEEGTKVWISVLGFQRDPDYYPEPDKFDPDRFSENKHQRHPYTFIPFGEGPRICIGLRFGMMQTKVGLSILLKNYKFSLSSKTLIPLELDPTNYIMTSKGGIWLDYTKV